MKALIFLLCAASAFGQITTTGSSGGGGSPGATGAPGAAGYSPQYIVAAGTPASGTGNNGDMYINSTTGDVYGPKASGAWPGSPGVNIKGSAGSAGYTPAFITASGVPSSGTGNNADMYINSATGDVYGPKSAGAWGSIATNIKGAAGPSGVVAATSPLSYNSGSQTVAIQQASGTQPGYLGSSDWSMFNAKAPTSNPTFTGGITLSGSGAGQMNLADSTGGTDAFYASWKGPSTLTASYQWVMPGSDCAGFFVLASDQAGCATLPTPIYPATSSAATNAVSYQYQTNITDASSTSYSTWANWWLRDGTGFLSGVLPTCTSTTGAGCTGSYVPDRKTLLITGVSKANLLEHTVWISTQCTGTELGCVPLNVFSNTQASASSSLVYAANFHATSCGGWKCNGTNFTDYDRAIIGFEMDTETRAPGGVKTSAPDIGMYSACVNCNSSKNSAFVADANASVGVGYSGYLPWGIGYQTTPYGAVNAFSAGAVCLPASGPCNMQPMIGFAYTDGAGTKATYSLQVLGTGVSQFKWPGTIQMLNSAGTALAVEQALQNFTAQTAAAYSLTALDMDSGTMSNLGATAATTDTLPTPAAGMGKTFLVQAAQTMSITGGSGVAICYLTICTATGGSVSTSAPYSSITIQFFSSTRWNVTNFAGSNWTVDGGTTYLQLSVNALSGVPVAPVTVTSSATPAFNLSASTTQYLLLSANATPAYSNITAGLTYNIIICQPASGGPYTFAQPAQAHGGMTIGTTAGKCSAQSFTALTTSALYATGPGVPNE